MSFGSKVLIATIVAFLAVAYTMIFRARKAQSEQIVVEETDAVP
ncbi:MAG TPA: hypothetical protein VM450_03620 [Thermomicrobiales bacterium]|nr:hypothetical protein [Thermomicrobiales bacterium]